MVTHGQGYSNITAEDSCGKLLKTCPGFWGRASADPAAALDQSSSYVPPALSACSACAGDYQDPERTAPPTPPEHLGAQPAWPEGSEADDEEERGADDEFPAKEV